MGEEAWAAEAGGCGPSWIFIHKTNKVKRYLMVLFFGLVCYVASPSWKFFCRRPWSDVYAVKENLEMFFKFLKTVLELHFCSYKHSEIRFTPHRLH